MQRDEGESRAGGGGGRRRRKWGRAERKEARARGREEWEEGEEELEVKEVGEGEEQGKEGGRECACTQRSGRDRMQRREKREGEVKDRGR